MESWILGSFRKCMEQLAGEEIVWGDDWLLSSLGLNAGTVRDNLSSSESPAGSTGGLITDELDRFALRPVGTGIERSWDGIEDSVDFGGTDFIGVSCSVLDIHHTGLHDLLRNLNMFGGEKGLGRVDVVNKSLSGEGFESGFVVDWDECKSDSTECGKDKDLLKMRKIQMKTSVVFIQTRRPNRDELTIIVPRS
ncbi:hypothetical protein GCK72_018150 [Caenorhabditis remanei]|uniref:Uncharacterized protein n=1 Tax=Caenorhabditis remanei TaxID=31234 RepID=A0A6A5G9U2_CAERE|nr:hypothetical protein GCK72_018150 [Caenorhabditis remanei]KAF1751596.1 hypothetical protein GCK72_018150 [Caenorhabditis remanei]